MAKLFLSGFLLLVFVASSFAQVPQSDFSRVKVFFGEKSIQDLALLGLEVDHGNHRKGIFIENDFSSQEIATLKKAGFQYEIIIEDVQAYYQNQAVIQNVHYRGNDCANIPYSNWKTPTQYTAGSMGGYLTLTELYQVLDTMSARYPNLITLKAPIDTFLTQEGRPVYYLKVANNPSGANKPKILYTALHHAREPNSLSQLIFYLWYLLENYETDGKIKQLVDNVEMYFIPCINPDGYAYNEQTNPNGGGLWRKNRWKHPDSTATHGVDLNRNYDFKWGVDDTGSSPSLTSNAFRGQSPASEPEVKAVNYLCNQNNFDIALNYHTYGNLLIHPWGYNDQTTPDHTTFLAFGNAMIKENNFFLGTGVSTVGYSVNGDSDDWMYGQKGIFSMTPEVGSGFWEAAENIDFFNKSTIYQNITAAKLLLHYVDASLVNTSVVPDGTFEVALSHPSLKAGEATISLTSITSNITITTTPVIVNMQHLEELVKTFDYSLAQNITNGETVKVELKSTSEFFEQIDTLDFVFWASSEVSFFEDGENNLANWAGNWETTTETFYSSDHAITDSPNDYYISNTTYTTKSSEIDLTNALDANLEFYAKWSIEKGYDYVQVLATTNDGLSTEALCGNWTVDGTADQAEDEPVYDGVQKEWVKESIDLQQFIGKKLKIIFTLVTDPYVNADGFYFDDLKVVQHLNPNATQSLIAENSVFIAPVPAKDIINISFSRSLDSKSVLKVYSSLGSLLLSKELRSGSFDFSLDISKFVEGLYFIEVQSNHQKFFGKFIKQ